jgi:hypothetical protein
MSPPNAAGVAQVQAIIGGTREITARDTWPDPDMRLVNDDRPLAPALDGEALPAGWGEWITAEAAARACPRDYVAAGLISAASAWIGNARRATSDTDMERACKFVVRADRCAEHRQDAGSRSDD